MTATVRHTSTASQLANMLVFVGTSESPVRESSSREEFPAHMVTKSSLNCSGRAGIILVPLSERMGADRETDASSWFWEYSSN